MEKEAKNDFVLNVDTFKQYQLRLDANPPTSKDRQKIRSEMIRREMIERLRLGWNKPTPNPPTKHNI